MTFPVIVTLLGLLLIARALWSHRQLLRAIDRARPPRPRLVRYPSVTVVRPIRGRDVDAEDNFAAALDSGYPGEVETLFVLDDERDPAYPLADAAVRAHRAAGRPGRAEVLIAGPPPLGRTGKLNAMIVGLERARGELIAFGDSDTRPDRDVLRVCVETLLEEPRAGCAFAPVVVANQPSSAGELGYALLINALYGTSVALCSHPSGDVPFIMGQLMVVHRWALDAIGGLACAEGQLVDDMHIGARLTEAGLRNVQSSHPLHIHTGKMSLSDFFHLFRRWLLFSRSGLPVAFTWPLWQRGIEFWLALAAGVLTIVAGHPLVALAPLLVLVVHGASTAELSHAFGGARVPARQAWMAPFIFVVSPLVLLSTHVHRQVNWRGREYALDAQARLA
jgi:ceramide glucosyltransferase